MAQTPRILVPIIAALFLSVLPGCHDPASQGQIPAVFSLSIVQLAAEAPPDSTVAVCWAVEGQGVIPHTAVVLDNESHGGDAVAADYAWGTVLPSDAPSTAPSGHSLPAHFCGTFTMPPYPLWLRAHAMVRSPGLLSKEHKIDPAPVR